MSERAKLRAFRYGDPSEAELGECPECSRMLYADRGVEFGDRAISRLEDVANGRTV